MRKTKSYLFEKIFFVFLLTWIALSFFDVGYNLVKTVSEAKFWLPLSDSQKRHEIFGNIYNFIVFVKNNTDEHSKILIYSNNDLTYYLGRYYLYPREISVVTNIKQISQLNTKNYQYTAVFNRPTVFSQSGLIASESSKQLGNWQIYKNK